MASNGEGERPWWTRVFSAETLKEAFTKRLLLKITAVLLALVLWLVVNAREPTQELVPVRFTPVLDSSLVLRDPVPDVQALVAGAPEDLIKLAATRLTIRRVIAADSPDTLALDIRPNDIVLPADLDGVVQIQDVRPRTITLRFESTWTRMVPVRSALLPPDSMKSVTLRLDPDRVQISGPRHVVLGVSFVRTVRATIPFSDSLPHLIDIDTTNLGVRVKPPQIKVYISHP